MHPSELQPIKEEHDEQVKQAKTDEPSGNVDGQLSAKWSALEKARFAIIDIEFPPLGPLKEKNREAKLEWCLKHLQAPKAAA